MGLLKSARGALSLLTGGGRLYPPTATAGDLRFRSLQTGAAWSSPRVELHLYQLERHAGHIREGRRDGSRAPLGLGLGLGQPEPRVARPCKANRAGAAVG